MHYNYFSRNTGKFLLKGTLDILELLQLSAPVPVDACKQRLKLLFHIKNIICEATFFVDILLNPSKEFMYFVSSTSTSQIGQITHSNDEICTSRCPESLRPDTVRPCLLPCKRDCLVTPYSDWSPCPSTCQAGELQNAIL